jgi:hypothetical protein
VGGIFKAKNVLNYRFWQDCWLLNVPLKITYEDLFKLARDPNAVVAEYWEEDEWIVDFKRSLSL